MGWCVWPTWIYLVATEPHLSLAEVGKLYLVFGVGGLLLRVIISFKWAYLQVGKEFIGPQMIFSFDLGHVSQ